MNTNKKKSQYNVILLRGARVTLDGKAKFLNQSRTDNHRNIPGTEEK
jgi:hypothetical protein